MSWPFKRVIRSYRWRLLLTYVLTLVENVFELLYPFAVGLAIDGLLRGGGVLSLAPLAAIWVAHVVTGTGRQLYDTRLFTAMYGFSATAMIVGQRTRGVSTREVSARADMMEEVIDFLEYELPALTRSAISILGSIGMLFLYDVAAGVITAALLVPIAVIQRLYGKRAFALNGRLNDRRERQVDTVADGRRGRVGVHFRALAKWRVKLSDAQAAAWSVTDLLSLGAVVLVLLHITATEGVQAGAIFAALAYVLAVADALEEAPVIVEQVGRLADISRRVGNDDDAAGVASWPYRRSSPARSRCGTVAAISPRADAIRRRHMITFPTKMFFLRNIRTNM